MESGYQHTYASSAAARASRIGLSSAPPAERSRQGSYATDGNPPSAAMFHCYSTPMSAASDRSPHYHHRDDEDDNEHSPSGFTSDSDGSDSSGSDYLCDRPTAALRSAYSEPAYPTTSSSIRRQAVHHSETTPPPLLPAERHALLDRIRQLSTREAETAAALAQANAENGALADEVHHWRAVAKESANARRAARDALSDVSSENARLAAAYTAHRIESEALRETLVHERARSDAQIRQLERSLEDATSRKGRSSSYFHSNSNAYRNSRAFGAEFNAQAQGGGDGGSQGRHDERERYQQQQKEAAPADSAAWDYERQELFDLLERLQDQLGIHSGYSRPASPTDNRSASYVPNSSRSRRASPRRRAASASAQTAAPEGSRSPTAGGGGGGAPGFEAAAPRTDAPQGSSPATGHGQGHGASTAPHSKFKIPSTTSAGTTPAKSPQCTGTPPPGAAATAAAASASTPTPREPGGVAYESSFESYVGDGGQQETTPSKFSTPVANRGHQAASPQVSRPQTSTSPFTYAAGVKSTAGHSQAKADPRRSSSSSPQVAPPTEHPAINLKREGDRLVQMKRYDTAIERYTAALSAAETGQSDTQRSRMTVTLLCARASAFMYAGRPLESAADCCRAQLVDPLCARALDVRAKSFFLMGAFEHAAEDLNKLRSMMAANEWGRTPALQSRLQEATQRAAADTPRNHYAVLGIKHSAVAGEIKASYRALALKVHPDKGGDVLGVEAATALFSLLSAANAALSTPQSRRAYDLELLRQKYVGTGPLSAGRQNSSGRGGGGFDASSWASGWTG